VQYSKNIHGLDIDDGLLEKKISIHYPLSRVGREFRMPWDLSYYVMAKKHV